MVNIDNRWIRGAIPALFIHLCIGSVYCWSLLKDSISMEMGVNVSVIEFAFTLAIFFLGMSAAFGGKIVEKDVKKSSFISMICFSLGLILSVVSIHFKSVVGLYLSYGVLMGIGLGIGYLSPVKTLMLWFKDNKGLATGIAIMGFGLSKSIFSPFIEWCNLNYSVNATLISIALISIVLMGIASFSIKKPSYWVEDKQKLSLKDSMSVILSSNYIKIWTIFFLNITCGLVIISFEKGMSLNFGIPLASIGLIASISAVFNALGRFGYATLSDFFNKKSKVYSTIFITCIVMSALFILNKTTLMWVLLLFTVNLGYGGGFSTLPNLLQDIFGMKNISTIHGFALSAWAWAAVAAFGITQIFIYKLGYTFNNIIVILLALYSIAFIISATIKYDKIK